MKSKEISQQLGWNGYATVSYPTNVKIAVNKVNSAWKSFCAQSPAHKGLITFDHTGGYENKNKREDPNLRENKENFHITLKYTFPLSVNPSPEDIALLKAVHELLVIIEPWLKEIDRILSICSGVDFSMYNADNVGRVLRLIHCYAQDVEILAPDHPDKGGHTLHLNESTSGLQGYWGNRWNNIDFSPNETVFFPGLLGQHLSNCKLKALTHRVVSNEESRKNGRYSMVLFNDYPNYPFKYGVTGKGYIPTQEMFTPGSHYNMSFDEFNHFFTPKLFQDAM